MIYIKTPINKANANDLYNFIYGVTSGFRTQLKIEKTFFGANLYYKVEVVYPDWKDRFFWEDDNVPELFVVGVDAAVSVIKPLLEMGDVVVEVEKESSIKSPEERDFIISYFLWNNKVKIERSDY